MIPPKCPMTAPLDPATDGAEMSFDGRMSYGDYLNLDKILTAQTLRSSAHDEMLFIIQHQTSELWMRLALHELTAARAAIAADHLRAAFKMLSRIARIFEQLNSAWDVLRTMTPSGRRVTACTGHCNRIRSRKPTTSFLTYSREPPSTTRHWGRSSMLRRPWFLKNRMKNCAGICSSMSGSADHIAAPIGTR